MSTMIESVEVPPAEDTGHDPGQDGPPGGRPPSAWQRLSFGAVRGLLRAHVALTGLRGLESSCRAFGTLEYLINHKRRRRVRDLLEVVFEGDLPGPRRRQLVRAHFMRERCDKAFYLIFDALSDRQIRRAFAIVNRVLLDEALARGRGAYIMLCHMGAHYVPGLVMGSMGYRVAGVRDPKEGGAIRYLRAVWERRHPDWTAATRVLYSNTFPREIYRLFKDNYTLGSALDVARNRDPNLRTVAVNIFGAQRPFLTGTLQIALRCTAPVLQGFIVADREFRYRLELVGPLADPQRDRESPETLRRILQQYADNIAIYARRYPEQVTRV